MLPVAIVRLDAVGWGEGQCALVNPVKAIRVRVGLIKVNKVQTGIRQAMLSSHNLRGQAMQRTPFAVCLEILVHRITDQQLLY